MSAAHEPVKIASLIGGQWVNGTGADIASENPAIEGQIVAAGNAATPADVDAAFAAARAAAHGWASTPMHARGLVLSRAAAIIEENAEAWGAELTAEEGKSLAEGVGEVRRAAAVLRYQAEAANREQGSVFASPRAGEQILVTHKPLGVVGVITPFNFPIAIPAWKIAPALIYGNTIVWKPASAVPLLAYRLASALHSAGLPAGVLNLILGGSALGDAIVDHAELDGLTFTGSTGVGRQLAGRAAGRGVPMQAEMGGKNASVVLADADLDLGAEQVLFGAFRSTGQKCTATSRLVLEESIADEFLLRLRALLANWKTGNPASPGVDMGPVVSARAAEGIARSVLDAVGQGATVLMGAEPAEGAFLVPTVLAMPEGDAGEGNLAWNEELFGPVLAVRRVSGVAAAFEAANHGDLGLSCAVFTRDIATALSAVDGVDVGMLHVNSESAGADPHVPFGGAKRSGYGPKEQGLASREFFTHTTTVYLRG
mgnify:FL=1